MWQVISSECNHNNSNAQYIIISDINTVVCHHTASSVHLSLSHYITLHYSNTTYSKAYDNSQFITFNMSLMPLLMIFDSFVSILGLCDSFVSRNQWKYTFRVHRVRPKDDMRFLSRAPLFYQTPCRKCIIITYLVYLLALILS
jgi:hypothetical protein